MTLSKRPRANFSALLAQRDAYAWRAADWRHLANRCADQPELVRRALAKAAEAQSKANALAVVCREVALNGAQARRAAA